MPSTYTPALLGLILRLRPFANALNDVVRLSAGHVNASLWTLVSLTSEPLSVHDDVVNCSFGLTHAAVWTGHLICTILKKSYLS